MVKIRKCTTKKLIKNSEKVIGENKTFCIQFKLSKPHPITIKKKRNTYFTFNFR